MATLSYVPEAIIQLVKYRCAKEQSCSTNRCQGCKAGLLCTDLCSCSDDDDECEDQQDDCYNDDSAIEMMTAR